MHTEVQRSQQTFPISSYINCRPLRDLCIILSYALHSLHMVDAVSEQATFGRKVELVYVIIGLMLCDL